MHEIVLIFTGERQPVQLEPSQTLNDQCRLRYVCGMYLDVLGIVILQRFRIGTISLQLAAASVHRMAGIDPTSQRSHEAFEKKRAQSLRQNMFKTPLRERKSTCKPA